MATSISTGITPSQKKHQIVISRVPLNSVLDTPAIQGDTQNMDETASETSEVETLKPDVEDREVFLNYTHFLITPEKTTRNAQILKAVRQLVGKSFISKIQI